MGNKPKCLLILSGGDTKLDGSCWGIMKSSSAFKIQIRDYHPRGLEFLQHVRENIIDLPFPKQEPPVNLRLFNEDLEANKHVSKDILVDTYYIKRVGKGTDSQYILGCLIRFAATHSFRAYNEKELYVPDKYFKCIEEGKTPLLSLFISIGGIPTYSFIPQINDSTYIVSMKAFQNMFVNSNGMLNDIRSNFINEPGGYVLGALALKTHVGGKTGKIYYREGKLYHILKYLSDGSVIIKNELGRQSKVKKNVSIGE